MTTLRKAGPQRGRLSRDRLVAVSSDVRFAYLHSPEAHVQIDTLAELLVPIVEGLSAKGIADRGRRLADAELLARGHLGPELMKLIDPGEAP